jgi:hypothetical protein
MADAGLLRFWEQDNGMYKFVVLPAWPHMVRKLLFMISYDEKLKFKAMYEKLASEVTDHPRSLDYQFPDAAT